MKTKYITYQKSFPLLEHNSRFCVEDSVKDAFSYLKQWIDEEEVTYMNFTCIINKDDQFIMTVDFQWEQDDADIERKK